MVHGADAEADPIAAAAEARSGRRGHEGHSHGAEATKVAALTERESLRVNLMRGAFYHDDRERFFSRVHRTLMFFVILAGASAGADLTKSISLDPRWLGIAAAVIGALDITWDVAGKARLHAMLKRDAFAILERLEAGREDLTHIRTAIARSHSDEPPTMHAVNVIAYNAAQLANGRPESTCVPISRWQRMMRNVCAFSPEDFTDKPETG